MSKPNNILEAAKLEAESAATWADLSNAVFDPIDGLIARAYPSIEERKAFRNTRQYVAVQSLVEAAMKRTGVVGGATPRKSGRFVVRLPRSLHAALEHEAETESVSLNQLVVAKLACQLDRLAGDQLSAVIRAFLEVRQGFSSDRVVADPVMNRRFLNRCRELGATGTDFELNWTLYNARKARHLANMPTKTKTFRVSDADEYEYASEIAVAYVKEKRFLAGESELSLDRIICDPDLAAEFDGIAESLAPGFSSLQYRWIALGIRKAGRHMKEFSRLRLPEFEWLGSAKAVRLAAAPEKPGLYLFEAENRTAYVAQTENLRHRIEKHLQYSDGLGLPAWLYGTQRPQFRLGIAPLPGVGVAERRALELRAVREFSPQWNVARVA